MNSYKKPSTTKLVKKFDTELKTLLMNDLNNVRGEKGQFTAANSHVRPVRLYVA